MGNVADQLPVLPFVLNLFLCGFLQPQAHVLIVAVQLSDFVGILRGQTVFKISLRDLLHGHVQPVDRFEKSLVYPLGQNDAGQNQNKYDG